VRPLSVGLQWVTRASGLTQLALGLAFWTGSLLAYLPVHMLNGLLFVLLLEVQAVLAAWAGVSWRLVAFAVAWGLIVPVFGMTQAQILPGDFHWLVQVAHLVVGLAAMALAERLAGGVQARLVAGRPAGPTPVGGRPPTG
jgi:energy-coupling factor transporter transmembrane protein EcfT